MEFDYPAFTDLEWKEELDKAIALAQSILSDGATTEMTPTLLVRKWQVEDDAIKDAVEVMVIDPAAFGKPHDMLAALGRKAAHEQVMLRAIFLVVETWTSKRALDGGGFQGRPIDDPNRGEAVLVAGKTLDGRLGGAIMRIERNAAGAIVAGQPEVLEGVSAHLLDAYLNGYILGMHAVAQRLHIHLN